MANTPSGNTVGGLDGNGVLVEIEFAWFGKDLFALDTQAEDATYNTYALLHAAFDTAPTTGQLSQWIVQEMTGVNAAALAQNMIDTLAPGISNEILITHIFKTVAGITPTQVQVEKLSALNRAG